MFHVFLYGYLVHRIRAVAKRELAYRASKRHAPPPATDEFSMLFHYSGGNRKLERWLLDEFRKEIEHDRAAIDAALLAEDACGLTRSLHRVKGAARTIGADDLARICEELERESGSGNVQAVRSCLAAFCLEADRLVERIKRY